MYMPTLIKYVYVCAWKQNNDMLNEKHAELPYTDISSHAYWFCKPCPECHGVHG